MWWTGGWCAASRESTGVCTASRIRARARLHLRIHAVLNSDPPYEPVASDPTISYAIPVFMRVQKIPNG